MIKVTKKDGTKTSFDTEKIRNAVTKSADRVIVKLSEEDYLKIEDIVRSYINTDEINVKDLHNIVERALDEIDTRVAKSYREYRNYKQDFVHILDEVYHKAQNIMYLGDKENSNTDSALVPTKRALVYKELNKELYNKFNLTTEEKQACRDGFIYIHDKDSRRDTMNCCIFDVATVMTGGFEMGNMWYNEPTTIDTACDVLSDIIMMGASSQYGGFSIPEVDKLLAPYVEKTYNKYLEEWNNIKDSILDDMNITFDYKDSKLPHKYALSKTKRDLEQGLQGFEMKFNSVASSRGDYPFLTFSFGENVSNPFSVMVTSALLKVRREGQGEKGKKKCVLFPKLVFNYVGDFYGDKKEFEWLFDEAISCSGSAMYPDYLSLTGNGYVAEMYKKYGLIVTPMGCRAFLSPYYERGGLYPADENDKPVFIGRFNIGAISLHLPMIYQESKENGSDFYNLLDYYLEMIRKIHLRTYKYLGRMKASTYPLAYCEGGFYGGNLNPQDTIKPILKSATASFGITALNELQLLHNGKSLVEDNKFSLEVMNYINGKMDDFKKEDSRLYAIYGTPAESLCGLQSKQFKARFGECGVFTRGYVTNSFHCHVTEDITPSLKQDRESEFWDLLNGGKIQYVKYPLGYNQDAIKTYVRRAMDLGLYEGVNLSLSFCEDCGYQENGMDICTKCGSDNLTKIERMNGYLSYSRVKGDTRLNAAKMEEIAERKSM